MFFFLPVAMHWLHQKNFKLLIVSPLRPLFPSLGFQRRLHSIKGVLGAWRVSVGVMPMKPTKNLDWLQREKLKEGRKDHQVTKKLRGKSHSVTD